MQGTVKSYDEATRTGSLLTDDRQEIPIDDRSFGDPSLRFLRTRRSPGSFAPQEEAG